jgi:hypothetical protein
MPFRYHCPRHGTHDQPGRCPDCQRERDRQHPCAQRRKIRSGWEWGRIREQVHRRDRVCVVCSGTERLQVHHRIPIAQGGANQLHNLELRCETHLQYAPHSRRKPCDKTNPLLEEEKDTRREVEREKTFGVEWVGARRHRLGVLYAPPARVARFQPLGVPSTCEAAVERSQAASDADKRGHRYQGEHGPRKQDGPRVLTERGSLSGRWP